MTGERLYAALLYVYPTRFRQDYGDQMLEAFHAARHGMTPVRFWLMILSDVCRSACLEHLRGVGPEPRRIARCALAGVGGTFVLVGSIAAVAAAAGGTGRFLSDELVVSELRTGWLPAATPEGQHKVVPFLTVTLENVSRESIERLHLTAVFRRVDEERSWGDAYLARVGADRLPPGASTQPLVLQSRFGYIGPERPATLFEHRQFIDVRVTLLARRGPGPWQRLGDWPVQRVLDAR